MSRIVNNLLTLARVDEGRLELLTTQVDLAEAVEAAVRPLRPLAAAKGLRLEVNGEHCEVQADPQRLHQALTNFIENAIKFSEPGGEVRVSAWQHNGEVGVTVTGHRPRDPARMPASRSSTASTAPTRHGGATAAAAGSASRSAARSRTPTAAASGSRARRVKGSSFSLALPAKSD